MEKTSFDSESGAPAGSNEFHLLSIALVSERGVELYTPVQPLNLTPEQIATIPNLPFPVDVHCQAPSPATVRNIVKEMLRDVPLILTWNLPHETRVLPFLKERDGSGKPVFRVQDVMKRSAPYNKKWNSFFSDYEFPTLEMAARKAGLQFQEPGWHDARADAKMVLDLWKFYETNPPFELNKHLGGEALPIPASYDECPF